MITTPNAVTLNLETVIDSTKKEIELLVAKYSNLPKTLKYEIVSFLTYQRIDGISLSYFYNLAEEIASNDPSIARLIKEAVVEISVDLEYLNNPEVAAQIGLEVMRTEKYMRDRVAALSPQGEQEKTYSSVVVMSGGMHLAAALPIEQQTLPYEASVTSGTRIRSEATLNDANEAYLREIVVNRQVNPILLVDDVMDTGTTFLTVLKSMVDMMDDADGSLISVVNTLIEKLINGINLLKNGNPANPAILREMVQADLKNLRELVETEFNIYSIFAADKISHVEDEDSNHALACFGTLQSPPWLMGWGMDTEINVNVTTGNVSLDLNICVGRLLRDIVALDIQGDGLVEPYANLSGVQRLALVIEQVFREKLGVPDAVVTLIGAES